MERVILQFMCVGSLAGVTYLHYTVLTSPNKGETAVHCCDPPLSVLVMLVSRNVFHVVSALQSIVFKILTPASLTNYLQCCKTLENKDIFLFSFSLIRKWRNRLDQFLNNNHFTTLWVQALTVRGCLTPH